MHKPMIETQSHEKILRLIEIQLQTFCIAFESILSANIEFANILFYYIKIKDLIKFYNFICVNFAKIILKT